MQPATASNAAQDVGSSSIVATGTEQRSAAMGIDFQRFLDCVHCGLCTAACPTYLETGDENDSPRGRIYLMRQIVEDKLELNDAIRGHLDLCLDCRACETACPSGVQYGRLIEPFRLHLEQSLPEGERLQDSWFARWILFTLFPYPRRLRAALVPARLAQRFGLLRLMQAVRLDRLLPVQLQKLVKMLPAPSATATPDAGPLPTTLPPVGKRRARVALFTGCVADALQRGTHWATAKVLQANGCEVIVPRNQRCCGAIHFHAGQALPAQQFALQNALAFPLEELDAVIVNVAGCGAMLKDYGHHWPGASNQALQRLASKVRDVHEFLMELGPIPPTRPVPLRATYHDACHLGHAQKVTAAPRQLLEMVPGVQLVPLPETEVCCGAAGTYNLLQPEMAQRLGERKFRNILSTGTSTVITANVGCILQIAQTAQSFGTPLTVLHPMEVLARSYKVPGERDT